MAPLKITTIYVLHEILCQKTHINDVVGSTTNYSQLRSPVSWSM